jgi:hypothetical protein
VSVVPLTPVGVQVLAAATVALVAGALTRDAADPTEVPGPEDLATGREHHHGHGGSP